MRRRFDTRIPSVALTIVAGSVLLSGCATKKDVRDLNARIDSVVTVTETIRQSGHALTDWSMAMRDSVNALIRKVNDLHKLPPTDPPDTLPSVPGFRP